MTPKNKKPVYRRKRYTIPIIIIVLLVAFRMYLPTLVKNHVNSILKDLPGYYGHVEDIDIALIRGAYVIDGLYLNKVNAETEIPFLKFPKSDISIEWKSLFKGKIVTEVIMSNPEISYVFEDQETEAGTPEADADDWTKALTEIIPIDINHFEIHNGKFSFLQMQAEPQIDLNFTEVEFTADNLRNVVSKEKTLPSPIHATGKSIGAGNMTLDGKVNLIKEVPDMDIAFSLENVDMTALNDFTKHYANINFERGNFGLFSEIAIADGYLKGYMKPLLADSVLIGKDDNFIETLWEGFIGFFKFALKNQKTDTLATKIPIEGDLNNVGTKVWPTITSIFKNAWIEAFKGVVDDDIEFQDAFQESNDE
ncbi:DUF748 domain-containing protein [Bizionia sp.]|uniref:DUF748 domain-containing protein n=1 Tax=Bizionia sp. TaxID=1954480 RepID=UPI003A912F6D